MKTVNIFRLIRALGLWLLTIGIAVPSRAQTAGGPVGPPTPAPLTVSIVAPTNGTFSAAPADITISANAQDYGAYVHIISFYSGTNLLATRIFDPISPSETNGQVLNIQYSWPSVLAGAYTLTVVASDTAGNSATSAPVNVTVLTLAPPLPVVTIFATDPIAAEGTNFPPYTPVTPFTNYMSGGTNTATFLVHRTGSTNSDLMVFYSIGGTASNGVDYAKLPGSVTIAAGKTYALITITPLKIVTPVALPYYRTVILGLIPPITANPTPASYFVGWPGKAEAIILERRFSPIGLPIPIRPTPPPIGPLADSSFNVNFTASNGQNFCVQVSTDLKNWTPVCTNTVIKGAMVFIDPEMSDFSARYYRTVPVATATAY